MCSPPHVHAPKQKSKQNPYILDAGLYPPMHTYQKEFDFGRTEVTRVDANNHILWVVFHVAVLVYALTNPCDVGTHVLECLSQTCGVKGGKCRVHVRSCIIKHQRQVEDMSSS